MTTQLNSFILATNSLRNDELLHSTSRRGCGWWRVHRWDECCRWPWWMSRRRGGGSIEGVTDRHRAMDPDHTKSPDADGYAAGRCAGGRSHSLRMFDLLLTYLSIDTDTQYSMVSMASILSIGTSLHTPHAQPAPPRGAARAVVFRLPRRSFHISLRWRVAVRYPDTTLDTRRPSSARPPPARRGAPSAATRRPHLVGSPAPRTSHSSRPRSCPYRSATPCRPRQS